MVVTDYPFVISVLTSASRLYEGGLVLDSNVKLTGDHGRGIFLFVSVHFRLTAERVGSTRGTVAILAQRYQLFRRSATYRNSLLPCLCWAQSDLSLSFGWLMSLCELFSEPI